ncbi:hypothetical protein SDRG_14296 [Saprolegnia diclina VS20]|uniref:Uncharacterized protein n=1 Tax=Saprolegnia diclina (strain VS20) TaxID=1156394 RepID=T0Q3P5_SAPDV|nr:hypothetical protein SDRG_14296 [Saprolegnia diclina VS20]EQC28025.1 hypothetical protein SDRG_14296 [Saprolegnia diclina VS20]|eukprot:XP_008618638.1 hypothetical protein SDRG_14296 [Saprolegnia diclina VS20]
MRKSKLQAQQNGATVAVSCATMATTSTDDIGQLFDEIVNKRTSAVSSAELSTVLPFTAGDVQFILTRVVDDMRQHKLELEKKEFTRYVKKATSTVSLAHVVVTLQRRRHMKTFSEYYLARGVAGAQLVGPAESATEQPGGASRRRNSRPGDGLGGDAVSNQSNDRPEVERDTKDDPQAQYAARQRISLVRACRAIKSTTEGIFAIAFNRKSRRLELHTVAPSTRAAQIYSSRYFVLLFSRDAGQLAIGCTGYLGGHIYLVRKQGCAHSAPPDILLTSYVFASRDITAVVGLAEPDLQMPATSDAPATGLITAPLDMFTASHVAHACCNHGTVTLCADEGLLEWSQAEVATTATDAVPTPLLTDGECAFPTIAHVNAISAAAFVMPRMLQQAAQGYCLYMSQRAFILEDDATPAPIKAMLDADVATICALWTEAKFKMGPRRIQPKLKNVKQLVNCGTASYTALTRDGQVYTWGQDAVESLGSHVALDATKSSPRKLPGFTKPVAKVTCGGQHVLGLDEAGVAYSWGSNAHGQLGLGHLNDSDTPARIAIAGSPVIIDIAAGDNHSLLLTNAGTTLACGNNWSGQLGTGGSAHLDAMTPVSLPPEANEPLYLVQAVGETSAAVSGPSLCGGSVPCRFSVS